MLADMRFLTILSFCLGFSCALAQAPKPTSAPHTPEEQWETLIAQNKPDQASILCTSWTQSSDLHLQVEAQKCLANVALCKGARTTVNGNEVGGGTLGTGYTPEAVDEALKHLNQGIRLAPQDVTLHESRLHVLEVAQRYDDMDKALEDSIHTYKGPHVPDIWLAYAPELADDGEPTAGLRFSEILYKYYPDNSDVIGNLGAFYNMLKEWDKGLPYVRRAAEMHPTDPLDTWNLGWTLNHLGQMDEADHWMRISIQLPNQDEQGKERGCLYGQFLVAKRNQKVEGCKFVMKNCEQDDRKECQSGKALPGK
jgi:tetratricopeptide (TPR) repeat protein